MRRWVAVLLAGTVLAGCGGGGGDKGDAQAREASPTHRTPTTTTPGGAAPPPTTSPPPPAAGAAAGTTLAGPQPAGARPRDDVGRRAGCGRDDGYHRGRPQLDGRSHWWRRRWWSAVAGGCRHLHRRPDRPEPRARVRVTGPTGADAGEAHRRPAPGP